MNNRNRNIVTGITLILLAVSLILWKLNVLNLPSAFADVSTWGLIVAVIMVIVLVHSIINMWYAGIVIPLALICIIFDKPLGITAISPEIIIIAAILITIALYLLFPRSKNFRPYYDGRGNQTAGKFTDSFKENYNENENGAIFFSSKFGSSTRYVNCQNLNTANLSSQFGEMSVFFDKARAASKTVYINCQVSIGAMDIYLPQSWNIENKVNVTLGYCDPRGTIINNTADGVTCVINGSVAFGELKIIRV
jgi:hypothetical protein